MKNTFSCCKDSTDAGSVATGFRGKRNRGDSSVAAANSTIRHDHYHNLGHTAAKLLLSDGIHLKIVQERLGHSLLTTYSHILPTMLEEASAVIAKMFPGKTG